MNSNGDKLLPSDYDICPEESVIHGVIVQARPNIHCVAHAHSVGGTAVSSQKDGLLNLTQQSMSTSGSLAYQPYESIVLDHAEGPRPVQDFGNRPHCIFRNHGLLTVDATVLQALNGLRRMSGSAWDA